MCNNKSCSKHSQLQLLSKTFSSRFEATKKKLFDVNIFCFNYFSTPVNLQNLITSDVIVFKKLFLSR